MKINIRRDWCKLPYYVFIDGENMKKSDGTGRRFKTEVAARKAAEKEIKNNLKIGDL